MRALLVLAGLAMLASAESPTGYSHRSSNSDLNFQPVPSVAQIHIPPSSQTSSQQYVMPGTFSTLEKQYAGPQVVYSSSHYTSPSASSSSSSSSSQQTSSSNQLQQYSPAPQQYATASSQQQPQYSAPSQQYSSSSQQYSPSSQQYSPSSQQYSASSQQQQYSAPSQQSYSAPSQQYSSSSSQQQSYSAPSQQQQQYAAPSQQQYSSPSQQYSQPANIQVSYGAPQLPHGASYGPPPTITGAGPEHNVEYRVVYVKGPKAPKPDLILPPPPPQQKTLVYILIPKIQPPEPIIVPTHPPTPPSKPEVFFIRYKAPKKARQEQSYSSLNSGYGSPVGAASGESPVVVEAPTKSDGTSKTLIRKSSSESSSYGDKVTAEQS